MVTGMHTQKKVSSNILYVCVSTLFKWMLLCFFLCDLLYGITTLNALMSTRRNFGKFFRLFITFIIENRTTRHVSKTAKCVNVR